MKKDMNEAAMEDILALASDVVGTRTFFIGVLETTFSVMKVFSKKNGSAITEEVILPLDQSI